VASTRKSTRKTTKTAKATKTRKTAKAAKTTKAAKNPGKTARKASASNGKSSKISAGKRSRRTKAKGPAGNGSCRAQATAATIDRRAGKDRRSGEDRRKKQVPVAAERRKLRRRAKVNRRRQIDPTTCERDYSNDEIEFMNALEQYKRSSGRMFPTCSEVLEVLRGLGYVKLTPDQAEQLPGQSAQPEPSELEQALNQGGRAVAEPALAGAPPNGAV